MNKIEKNLFKGADVHMLSPVAQNIEMRQADEMYDAENKPQPAFVDEDGFQYFLLDKQKVGIRQNLQIEHFVSLFSKGILHTSDIVEIDGHYYSRANGNYLDDSAPAKPGEREAEMFLLKYLFEDWDKNFVKQGNFKNYIEGDTTFTHYDYGEAFSGSAKRKQEPYYEFDDLKKRKDMVLFFLEHPLYIDPDGYRYAGLVPNDSVPFGKEKILADEASIKKNVLDKVAEFRLRLEEDNGHFFDVVMEKAHLDMLHSRLSIYPGSTPQEKKAGFKAELLDRLIFLQNCITNEYK